MNSTELDEAAMQAIGQYFDTVLMPLAASRWSRHVPTMPLSADPALSSYWAALSVRTLERADFLQPSCLDANELAVALAQHWSALGEPDLAALAGRLVALAQALRTQDAAPDEPSPYIYTMF